MEAVAKNVSVGQTATSHTAANVVAVSALIMANRRITFNEMQEETWLAQGPLQAIVHDNLEVTKVCAVCTHITTEGKMRLNLQRTSCTSQC